MSETGQTQVVILCGGTGSRSYPFTEYYPKPMMPIVGTPILVHLMKIFASQGYCRFILAAGHRKEILIDYFRDRSSEWEVEVIDTGSDSGTGERIRRCAPRLNGRFMATYGDGVGNVNLAALLDNHKRAGGTATLTTVPLRSQYGTIEFDSKHTVMSFREKPIIDSVWINAGFFVFEPSVFSLWEGESLESHVLPKLAARGELHAYQHRGFWRSVDTTKDQKELEELAIAGDFPWLRI